MKAAARARRSRRLRRGNHSGRRAFLLGPAAAIASAGAGRHRVRGRGQPVQGVGPQTALALHRSEFFVAIAALLGVLGQGLLRGVLIGAIISLVLLIRRASRPHVAFLGRIPGARRFSDHGRHPDNELIPGVMIFRPESGLMYFNMDHVRDTIVDRVRAETTAPKLVVLDLSAAPRVDMHSAQMLGSMADELTATGIRVQAVEARSSVRERLRSEGVEARLGGIDRFTTVADAIESFQESGAGLRVNLIRNASANCPTWPPAHQPRSPPPLPPRQDSASALLEAAKDRSADVFRKSRA